MLSRPPPQPPVAPAPALPPRFDVAAHAGSLAELVSRAVSDPAGTTATLLQCERVPGYCTVMMELVAGRGGSTLDSHSQLMAVICVRNCVDRHWNARRGMIGRRGMRGGAGGAGARRPPPVTIHDDEKAYLRSTSIAMAMACDGALAQQVCLLAAKIARKDWPSPFKELLPGVFKQVSDTCRAVVSAAASPALQPAAFVDARRCLLFVHTLIKQLASNRTIHARTEFHKASTHLFGILSEVWRHVSDQIRALYSSAAAASPPADPAAVVAAVAPYVSVVSLALKTMVRLVTYGDAAVVHADACRPFWNALVANQDSYSQLHELLASPAFSAVPDCSHVATLVAKAALHISRCIKDGQQAHPMPFRWCLPQFLQYCLAYVTTTTWTPRGRLLPRLALYALNTLANVASESLYHKDPPPPDAAGGSGAGAGAGLSTSRKFLTARGDVDATPDQLREMKALMGQVFTADNVTQLVQLVVTRCMVVSDEDLEAWMEDPEEFMLDDESYTIDERLRPCGEHLLLALNEYHGAAVPAALAALLKSAEGTCTTAPSDAAVRQLDAVYVAMGINSYLLSGVLDFGSWFMTRLVPVLQTAANPDLPPMNRVLLRRVLWLLSCWLPSVTATMRKSLYPVLSACLQSPDAAVSLTACDTLQGLLADCEYVTEDFDPVVEPVCVAIFRSIARMENMDSKLRLLGLTEEVVRRSSKAAIARSAVVIVRELPGLWDGAASQNLIRSQVLKVLTQLTLAAEDASKGMWPFVLPLVGHAVDTRNPEAVYLAEDGLLLWAAVLEVAPEYPPALSAVFPLTVGVPSADLSHTPQVLRIVEAYAILGREAFVAAHGGQLAPLFAQLVGHVQVAAAKRIAKCVHTILTCCGDGATAALEPVLMALISACFEGFAEEALALAVEDLKARRRYRLDNPPKHDRAVLTAYLTVLARAFAQSPASVMVVFRRWEAAHTSTPSASGLTTLQGIAKAWVDRIDDVPTDSRALMPGPWRRKVCVLALLALLQLLSTPGSPPEATQLLGDILDGSLSAAAELVVYFEHATKDSAASYIPGMGDGESGLAADDSPDFSTRSRIAFLRDFAVRTDLDGVLRQTLATLRTNVGDAAFAAAMATVDPSTLKFLPK